MDEHFNEILKLFKNQPNELDISSANEVGSHLVQSPNQEMLIDIISTRPLEDRILVFACLSSLRGKYRNVKDIEIPLSLSLNMMRERDIELRDIDDISFSDANKISSGLVELLAEADLGNNPPSNEDKINNVVGRAVLESPYLFSSKSLFSITVSVLGLVGTEDFQTIRFYALLRDAVLRGRQRLK